jgi:hypothetical protein
LPRPSADLAARDRLDEYLPEEAIWGFGALYVVLQNFDSLIDRIVGDCWLSLESSPRWHLPAGVRAEVAVS